MGTDRDGYSYDDGYRSSNPSSDFQSGGSAHYGALQRDLDHFKKHHFLASSTIDSTSFTSSSSAYYGGSIEPRTTAIIGLVLFSFAFVAELILATLPFLVDNSHNVRFQIADLNERRIVGLAILGAYVFLNFKFKLFRYVSLFAATVITLDSVHYHPADIPEFFYLFIPAMLLARASLAFFAKSCSVHEGRYLFGALGLAFIANYYMLHYDVVLW